VIHVLWVPRSSTEKRRYSRFLSTKAGYEWTRRVPTAGQCTENCAVKDHGFMRIVVEKRCAGLIQTLGWGEQRAAAEKEKELLRRRTAMAELMEARRAKLSKRLCRLPPDAMAAGLAPSRFRRSWQCYCLSGHDGPYSILWSNASAVSRYGKAFASSSNEVGYCGDHPYERNAWG